MRVTLIVMSSYVHVVMFALLAIIPATSGHGGGAPKSACVKMSPSHGEDVKAQSDSNPYTLKVDGHDISKGGTLKVCVTGRQFKGILLQMRAEGSETPVGTFNGTRGTLANDTKLMTCTADGDTVTHSKPTNKTSPTCFYWKAPDNEVPQKSHFV
ncbi:hypothetical protein NP493_36g03013 [Ridgeia piscesae]|uniref:Reelin domain-containing protein n=1 Tax=Ridgeia piscesae TaxID=27915 RepID=A0AAD9UJW3_RIDPI|nr:hypothetical protein NP493_36g03013 [Ridgeia piscesae]